MCAANNNEEGPATTDYIASSDVSTKASNKGTSNTKGHRKASALLGEEDYGQDIGLQPRRKATRLNYKYVAVAMLLAIATIGTTLYFQRGGRMQLARASSNSNVNASGASSNVEENTVYSASEPDSDSYDEGNSPTKETNSTNTTVSSTASTVGSSTSSTVTSYARSSVASAVTSSATKKMTTYAYGGNWGGRWWNGNYGRWSYSRSSSSDKWWGKKNKWNRKWGYGSSSSDYNNWWWGGSCFPASEMVDLVKDEHEDVGATIATPIEHVEPGDIALGGGKVKAILKVLFVPQTFTSEGTIGETMYHYNSSTCVTGSHAVPAFEHGSIDTPLKLQRVKDSPLAVEDKTGMQCGSPEFLYNLVTEHHVLTINGTVLADYDEADSTIEAEMIQLRQLNGEATTEYDETIPSSPFDEQLNKAKAGQGAFAPGTLVDVVIFHDDTETIGTVSKRIEDIEPGEMLSMDCGVVLGRVTLLHDNCDETLVQYNDDTIVSPWTAVRDASTHGIHDEKHEDKKFVWRHVKDSPLAKNLYTNNKDAEQKSKTNSIRAINPASAESESCIMHQLITSTHQIPVNGGILFADYEVAGGNQFF